ncbi:TonB-dependent receptor [Paracoccus sediminis]|uniref:TonB-dependent receptor n=1 Tax=Paracoccus sediminis TaxID=1214787 RepID=A0A238URQ8_9RHOB|nr:TonB-dependent receptor [Paracoccus sediminis]TBN52900.1 TonB-dependent receptor [Paracoccus sediminis]SNR24651.1 vitamin B12 transporter [Paracoccus sediminis]
MTRRPFFLTLPPTLIAALSLTTALPAAAQDGAQAPYVLGGITLTANREAIELSRSGSSVSVLSRDALNGLEGQPLSRSLTRLPGVTLSQQGPLGTLGALQLRGAPAQYLPVLIDGIEVSDPAATKPYYDMGGQIGQGIGRMELLRGAQSALYGSRAVAGVLSLQSLRPTEDGLRHHFGIEAGSYDTLTASYGATLRRNGTDLAFQVSHVRTDGFSALDENDGNSEDDGYEATRLSFYSAQELQNGAVIGFNGFWEDSTGDFDDFLGDVAGTPGDDYSERESYGLRGFARFATGAIDHDIALTRYRIDRTSVSDGFESPFTGTRTKLSWQGAADIGQGVRAVFGADTEKEVSEGNGEARLNGVFVETTTALGDRIDITTSLRRDDHSRFGGFTSGRVAAVYRAPGDLLFRAAIGNGFRAPSLYELFGDYGDPTLRREASRTHEIGVEKQWGDSHLRATAFWLRADSLIGFDFAATACGQPFGCYAQVDGTARRRGVEIDGRYAFGAGHALTASYTFIDNQVDVDWARVPERVLNLGAETTLATGTTARIDLQHVAGRTAGLDDFTIVDLLVSHPVRDNADAYLRLENVFDEDYQWVRGYGTSGRAFYAGLRASF